MSAPPPTPTLKKSVAVPSRLEGPEHEHALQTANVTDELAVEVINHALYGNPRPVVTNTQVQAILDHYDLSQHASKIRDKFGLPAVPAGGRKLKGGEDMPLYSAINKIITADEKRYKKGAATLYDDSTKEMTSALAMKYGISFERMQRIKSLLDDAKKYKDIDESLYNAALADLRKRSVLPTGAGGFKRNSQTERFSRCVKMVRRTVTPRSGSNKESAAIAICTKTILQKRGRTIKRYSKKRLVTQRRK